MFAALLLLAVSAPNFDRISREAHGHVGAVAMVLNNGRALQLHADERFPMQSVYKFPIAMAVLHAVDQGTLQLDESVTVSKAELVPASLHSPIRDQNPQADFAMTLRDLLRYTVSESDGTASDVLLRVVGGPATVQAFLATLGLTNVRIATTEMEMARDDKAQYRNWATPRGMLSLLQALHEGCGLSPASRQYLLGLMTKTGTGPNRLRGLLPAGTVVAHKTGTSNSPNGFTAATNDAGLITLPGGETLAVVVFVSDSAEDTLTRERVIAKIARAAWDWALTTH